MSEVPAHTSVIPAGNGESLSQTPACCANSPLWFNDPTSLCILRFFSHKRMFYDPERTCRKEEKRDGTFFMQMIREMSSILARVCRGLSWYRARFFRNVFHSFC